MGGGWMTRIAIFWPMAENKFYPPHWAKNFEGQPRFRKQYTSWHEL